MPIISYGLDARGLKQGVTKVKSSLKSISSTASTVGSALGKMFTPLNLAIGSLGAGFGAFKLAEIGDAYTNMSSQLEHLTDSTWAAEDAQKQLYEMSQRTGTSVIKNSKALTRFALASEMTGLNMDQNISVLGSINSLMIKTGVSTQEASAGMVQLGQAMASGRLQGDEYRSISENIPALMDELSKSLGVTRGELKKLSTEGKLTSEVLGQAFLGMVNDSSIEELPLTIGRMWTTVVNASQRMWVAISDQTGILSFVANGFKNLATWVEENTDTVVSFFVDIKDKAVEMWPEIRLFFGNLLEAGTKVVNWFLANPDAIPNFIKSMTNAINSAFPTIIRFYGYLSNVLSFIGKVTASAGAIAGTVVAEHQTGTAANFESIKQAASEAWNDSDTTSETAASTTDSREINNVSLFINESFSRSDTVNIATELARNEARD